MKKAFVRITANGRDRNGNKLWKIYAYKETDDAHRYEMFSRDEMKLSFRGRINKDGSITRQAYRHEIENVWQAIADKYETNYIFEES